MSNAMRSSLRVVQRNPKAASLRQSINTRAAGSANAPARRKGGKQRTLTTNNYSNSHTAIRDFLI
jgi:hypothetical protein